MNTTSDQNRWFAIAAVVIVALLIIAAISYIWFPLLPWTEERDAGEETVEQTIDSEKAIQQYEEFRFLYDKIEVQRNIVDNRHDELDRFYEIHGEDPDEWSRQATEDHSRIQLRITASQNQLEILVGDYNAQSSMANRELFKCHLPYQVDDRFAINGPPGSAESDQPIDTGPDGEPINGTPPEDAEQCDGLPQTVSA